MYVVRPFVKALCKRYSSIQDTVIPKVLFKRWIVAAKTKQKRECILVGDTVPVEGICYDIIHSTNAVFHNLHEFKEILDHFTKTIHASTLTGQLYKSE